MILSHFVGSIFGFLTLAVFVGIAVMLKVWHGTPKGRMAIDATLLKLPLIGILLRKIAVARFTRTLGTLIRAVMSNPSRMGTPLLINVPNVRVKRATAI